MSSVARVTEIIASSDESFDEAIKSGIKRANKTLKNVVSAWIASQDIEMKNGKVSAYRVRMKVTFILS